MFLTSLNSDADNTQGGYRPYGAIFTSLHVGLRINLNKRPGLADQARSYKSRD